MASVDFRWNVSGSFMQVIPRFVSVDKNGKEREFLKATPNTQTQNSAGPQDAPERDIQVKKNGNKCQGTNGKNKHGKENSIPLAGLPVKFKVRFLLGCVAAFNSAFQNRLHRHFF